MPIKGSDPTATSPVIAAGAEGLQRRGRTSVTAQISALVSAWVLA